MQEELKHKMINRFMSKLTGTSIEDNAPLSPEAEELFKDIPYISIVRPLLLAEYKSRKVTLSRLTIKYGLNYAQALRIKKYLK